MPDVRPRSWRFDSSHRHNDNDVSTQPSGCHTAGTPPSGTMGSGQPFPGHADVLARHQHRQCRPAEHGRGLCRLLPAGAVDRPRLPPGLHHPDRRRRPPGRRRRPAKIAAGRHRAVHGGLGAVRCRGHALAADRRPGPAGTGCRHHDGPRHGPGRRSGAEGQDGECHGAARHDVGHRHSTWPITGRRPDRRPGLARTLPRQPAAGPPGATSWPIAACRPTLDGKPTWPASTGWARCSWP